MVNDFICILKNWNILQTMLWMYRFNNKYLITIYTTTDRSIDIVARVLLLTQPKNRNAKPYQTHPEIPKGQRSLTRHVTRRGQVLRPLRRSLIARFSSNVFLRCIMCLLLARRIMILPFKITPKTRITTRVDTMHVLYWIKRLVSAWCSDVLPWSCRYCSPFTSSMIALT